MENLSVYKIEGTRQGEYFHSFIRARSPKDAIEKWEKATRFQGPVGKENLKKYQNIKSSKIDHEVSEDLIY